MVSGLKMALIYGFKPWQLGLCGPKNKEMSEILFAYLAGEISAEGGSAAGGKNERKIRRILKLFKTAYLYYSLIAKANKIKDPLDQKVVEAYWLGNKLLDKVRISDLKDLIAKGFGWPDLVSRINQFSRPHHNFHVLMDVLASDKFVSEEKLIDCCCINYGEIKRLEGKEVIVESRSLISQEKIHLGEKKEIKVGWNKLFLPKLKKNDWISFHWLETCQRLSKNQVKNLDKYTKLILRGT